MEKVGSIDFGLYEWIWPFVPLFESTCRAGEFQSLQARMAAAQTEISEHPTINSPNHIMTRHSSPPLIIHLAKPFPGAAVGYRTVINTGV